MGVEETPVEGQNNPKLRSVCPRHCCIASKARAHGSLAKEAVGIFHLHINYLMRNIVILRAHSKSVALR